MSIITRRMRGDSEQEHIEAFREEAKRSALHTAKALDLIRRYKMHRTPERRKAVHDIFNQSIRGGK